MPTFIDTIFEKGVFRPLKPVSTIAENQLVTISVPEYTKVISPPEYQEHVPMEYPLDDYPDLPEDTYEYQSVPAKVVGTIKARLIFDGEHKPAPYPDEE